MKRFEGIDKTLSYNPDTGVFKHVKTGEVAGSKESTGYVRISVKNRKQYAHRLAWYMVYGEIKDGVEIDHKNGIRDDNRIENLRLSTRSKNGMNRKLSKPNKLGIRGVRRKPSGSFEATITRDGLTKSRTFGAVECAQAWVIAERSAQHGEFAKDCVRQ